MNATGQYWHVRVSPKDPGGKRSKASDVVLLDRDRAWVDARILEPRRRNQPITVSGRQFEWSEIDAVRISVSDEPSSAIIERLKVEDSRRSVMVVGGASFGWRAAARATDMTDELIDSPVGAMSEATSSATSPADPKTVMVVYGRDEEARRAMFDFLRALKLSPQEWGSLVVATGSGAPYIGEVLDRAFEIAKAVVVLFTPDDEAYLRTHLRGAKEPDHETAPTPQARPNVLFEAGMALGVHPDRTILVELGTLRPFSDIYGRHAVRLDGTQKPLREIARRLKAIGCDVDESGDDWASTAFPSRS